MTTAELINHDLPILKLTDTVSKALLWMEENRISQLAVKDEDQYAGIVSEDLLLNYEEEMLLSDVMMEYSEIYLTDYQHIYEALNFLSKFQLKVIGVLDHEKNFMGIVTASDIYNKFSELLGTNEQGAVLVISLKNRDYSLAEISRLVESNDTKILSSYFSGNSHSADDFARLTLKLNKENISPVINTLERFGYNIESAYAHEPVDSIEQENYDSLMRYLSV